MYLCKKVHKFETKKFTKLKKVHIFEGKKTHEFEIKLHDLEKVRERKKKNHEIG